MYDNAENLKGLNKSEFFQKMLSELSWSQFCTFIQNTPQVSQACLFGGQRLDSKFRKTLEARALREAEKSNYADGLRNNIFTIWYPLHKDLNNTLETYLKSEEYKNYQKDNGLKDDDYVLSDEKFEAFFSVNELTAWKILLLFSPMKFSDEQAAKILDCQQGSGELLDKIAELEKALAEAQRKATLNDATLERLKAKQNADANELLNLKKSNREAKQAAEAAQKKFEASQAEIKRLNAKLANADSAAANLEKSANDEAERKIAKAMGDAARMSQELQTWKAKYEEQRLANRHLEESAAAALKDAAGAQTDVAKMVAKMESVDKFIDALLAKVDWSKAGAAMKLNPAMRRSFNNMMKKLNYDADGNLTIEGTLPEFWKRLSDAETALIKHLANSNVEEVANGDLDAFWEKVDEDFIDVRIGLEARLVLLDTIHEIFFQIYSADDLKKATIPAPKKK